MGAVVEVGKNKNEKQKRLQNTLAKLARVFRATPSPFHPTASMATLTPPSDTAPPADTDAGVAPATAADTNAAAAAPPTVAEAPAEVALTTEKADNAPPQPTTAASSDDDDDDDEGADPGANGVPGAPRPRKRKVALFLAYVGAGYSVSRG